MARLVSRMRPVHPGEVLREDYLAPLGLGVNVRGREPASFQLSLNMPVSVP